VKPDQDNRRFQNDRRKRPTPLLSRYTFFGRRKEFRREIDQQKGGYVDRYSPILLFFLISIAGLNVLDALFTIMILDLKGWEVNPIVRSVMEVYGENFWVWKFVLVSSSLILVCLHSRFRRVKVAVVCISFIYWAVILYQVFLITHP
jgi:hypothetical protein